LGRCPTSAHSPSLGVHGLTRRLATLVSVVVLQRKRRTRCTGRLLPPHQSTTEPTCNLRPLQIHVFCECSMYLPVVVDLGLVVPLVPGLFRDLASALPLAPLLRQHAPYWCCHHILCRVVFPSICHPPSRLPPLGRCWVARGSGARMRASVSLSVSREVVVSSEALVCAPFHHL
jgi:hypothetical protein